MKPFLLICILTGCIHTSSAQEMIFRESDSARHFSFTVIKGGKITKYKESYDILQGSMITYMTNWSASKDGILYWTNGENIYKCNFEKGEKSSLVYSKLYYILEFTVRNNLIYIIYNPSREEGLHNNRYSGGLKFCRINVNNWNKENLWLPPGYNITNLAISPDGQWASFIHTKTEKEAARYELVLYNLLKKNSKIIDKADSRQMEWFGNDDMFNSAVWAGPDTLLYYKHLNDKNYGQIVAFNLKTGNKKISLSNFPQRDFSWFGFDDDNQFYFSERHNVYKTKDGINKEQIYNNGSVRSNILNGLLLPE